jgi:hypothetical protein
LILLPAAEEAVAAVVMGARSLVLVLVAAVYTVEVERLNNPAQKEQSE